MDHEGISNKQNLVTELPTTSPDFVCRFYLQEIARLGKTDDVLNSINQSLESTPALYGSTEEFLAANPDYDEKIDTNLSPDEKKAVKEYSGYSFAWINSVARGFWDYDKMGRKTPEMEEEIKETTRGIVSAIKKAPAPTQDFMTFRGTNLDGFRAYGINANIFGSLNEDQLKELDNLLDNQEDDPAVFQDFFERAGISLNQKITEAAEKFSAEFLGGNND